MSYVDGFVIPVPAGREADYQAFARQWAPKFKEHGAIRIVECMADDVPDGKRTDFKRAVALEEGESLVFSWIIWPSKDVRDKAYKAMEGDGSMSMPEDMPMDGKRMIWGGFKPFLDTDEA